MATSPTPSPASPLAPPPGLPLEGEVHLLDRLSVIYKYRRGVLGVFLVVVAWFMVDSYTVIPMYRAQAQLEIQEEKSNINTPAEIANNLMYSDPEVYKETQYRILRGRELVRRVVRKIDLSKVPEFNGQGPKPTALAEGIAVIKWYAAYPVRALFRSEPPKTEPRASNESETEAGHVDAFISRINVAPIRQSNLVYVTFESADPDFAARAVNTLAQEYIAQNLELKIASLNEGLKYLEVEVGRQYKAVEESERALAEYRDAQGAQGLAENIGGSEAQQLTQLTDAVMKAQATRIQALQVWNQVRDAAEDAVPVIINNPMLQGLAGQMADARRAFQTVNERFGQNHPTWQEADRRLKEVEARYQTELAKVKQAAKSEFDTASANERELRAELDKQKSATTVLNRKGIDYSLMQRTAETNRTIYNSLLTRQKELEVLVNSTTNNVRMTERAEVPGGPFSPNHRTDWIYALAFGLVLAFATAFGIDYLDDTVKTPEDITRRLKLRFLGLVPAIRGERHPLLSGPVPHDFSEAFRSLRTALVTQSSGEGPRIIAITSAQPLEGKTTTAVNIAMALAVGGSRVLLIDADMRRPSVHKALRIPNDRGLSQLLAGQARMREVVQRTHDPNLLVISAGRTPSNPSELLSSDRMRALIGGLETGPFDWVIIDTPPVLAVTDAVIVAPLVAGVTFVIGAEMTRWRLAERAVQTILSSNPRSMAAVLNKVDFARNKYYYSRYYGHQYKSYYAEAPAA